MKKYYTTISQQPKEMLRLTAYENPGQNPVLECSTPTHFPIIPLIRNTAKKGEQIKIVAVKPAYATTDYCLSVLKNELEAIKAEIEFEYGEIELIDTPISEIIDNHLDLFGKLIKTADDGDRIYADITYGTKPIPMILMMYMNYAYKFFQDISIENVIYGAMDHSSKKSYIYDVSALFYMNSTINSMKNVADPEGFIRTIIDM